MVQLKILSGKKAGVVWAARRFPVRVGRAPSADLQLDENGIWDQHLLIEFNAAQGFLLCAQGQAMVSLNGQPVRQAVLRNGDAFDLGAAKLQFWLGDTRQVSLAWRETLSWAVVLAISLTQIGLLYWLLR